MVARAGGGPAFFGLGAQQAGVTWLYERLRRHPQLRVSHVGRDFRAWEQMPTLRDFANAYRRRYGRTEPGCLHGEITSTHATLAPEQIAVMRRDHPDLRLFYLLRSPVERAWTAALLALERATMGPDEASDAWFVDHFRSARSRGHGDYVTCLRNWHAHYLPEQLHVMVVDDLRRQPRDVLRGLYRHLGVSEEAADPPEAAQLEGLDRAGEQPLPARFRRELLDVYRRPVREL